MIYLVTGFFRSGTSMMMQALEAGGLPVYHHPDRDAVNERWTDQASRPNPRGLYEPSTDDLFTPGFPRMHDGCAVKLLIPWLWSLAVHDYRVVVMIRDPAAILASYERAFKDFWDGRSRARWITEYPARIVEAQRGFKNRRDVRSVTPLVYNAVLGTPRAAFTALAQDGFPVDVEAAASVVGRRWTVAHAAR